MNSTGRLSAKGSSDAAEWAAKRKQQMERARQLKEERKSGGLSSASGGGSVFKNAGQDFVHRNRKNTTTRSEVETMGDDIKPRDDSPGC